MKYTHKFQKAEKLKKVEKLNNNKIHFFDKI